MQMMLSGYDVLKSEVLRYSVGRSLVIELTRHDVLQHHVCTGQTRGQYRESPCSWWWFVRGSCSQG